MKPGKALYTAIADKSLWLRNETLKLHGIAQETRIASSLSPIDILSVLFYGKLLKYKRGTPEFKGRDYFIASKGHGSIALYPLFADLQYYNKDILKTVSCDGSIFGGIPDPVIPGYETINGSLGHGLGVGCGIALGLRSKTSGRKVFVLHGDGELNEGSVWEAVMLAGQLKLSNLILIIDANKKCMLDYCSRIIDLEPLENKFAVFNWETARCDGHDINKIYSSLTSLISKPSLKPKVLIADTIKGKGIPELVSDPICHVKSLSKERVTSILKDKICRP